jgi:hypothetical protein
MEANKILRTAGRNRRNLAFQQALHALDETTDKSRQIRPDDPAQFSDDSSQRASKKRGLRRSESDPSIRSGTSSHVRSDSSSDKADRIAELTGKLTEDRKKQYDAQQRGDQESGGPSWQR